MLPEQQKELICQAVEPDSWLGYVKRGALKTWDTWDTYIMTTVAVIIDTAWMEGPTQLGNRE
jgi:hypothetical protein